MSSEDRIRWDNAYRQRLHRAYPSPDPLLLQFTPPLDKALGNKVSDAEAQDDENSHTPDNLEESVTRALDLAAGWGQNGLWLAEQGYNVDIMDISRVALQRARAEMAVRNLRNINLLQMDVDDLQLEPETI
jgi:2-polyprenyl-3-methyl-5-hydroxy-6-metoxy-1,4-benzoquinol methylase